VDEEEFALERCPDANSRGGSPLSQQHFRDALTDVVKEQRDVSWVMESRGRAILIHTHNTGLSGFPPPLGGWMSMLPRGGVWWGG